MTSLELFREPEPMPREPSDWGTGKLKSERVDIWAPRNATWKYSGEPIMQHYALTQLKLSNVRSNDELIPRPQEINIGPDLINLPFPAEHPYSSHIPRLALFPKFDSPEDPKRGVAARNEKPINSEMPAQPYDIIVKEKIKGFGNRHEIQTVPKGSEKQALVWPGDNFFDQQVKVHGGRQQFYPVPPKTVLPNLQPREGDMSVSERTANTLRNLERAQWMTSHQLEFTGLGPSNPLALDNLDDKHNKFITTGLEDDKLYPHFTSTFDPPRGMEGRIARKATPAPKPQRPLENISRDNSGYKRKMTLTEREEHRLLHGTEYVNLPDTSNDPGRDVRWRELQIQTHPGPQMEKIEETKRKLKEEEEEEPLSDDGTHPPSSKTDLLTSRDMKIQEMEAKNRWKELELQTPDRDITALQNKYDHLTDQEKPATFYKHEGRYNEERAGLYKTSYDPHRFAHSMNALSLSAPEMMSTLNTNPLAQQPTSLPASRLNEDSREALKWSRSFSMSQPDLCGDRWSGAEVVQPFKDLKQQQCTTLQPPGPHQANLRVQEKTLLQRSATTMGDAYNVPKFLQENTLDPLARSDPLAVMSSENQSLSRVRSRSFTRPPKSVQFSDNVTVATLSSDSLPLTNLKTQPLSGAGLQELAPLGQEAVKTTQYTSTHAQYNRNNELNGSGTDAESLRHATPAIFSHLQSSNRREDNRDADAMADRNAAQASQDAIGFSRRRPATSHGVCESEYKDQFSSLSTNFVPSNLRHSIAFASSYQNQFPVYDLSYKKDARFDWQPGCGSPRPQTSLLEMQDKFKKSEVRRKFHELFPETNPELRFNIVKGKKHNFYGFNCQVIRG